MFRYSNVIIRGTSSINTPVKLAQGYFTRLYILFRRLVIKSYLMILIMYYKYFYAIHRSGFVNCNVSINSSD
jgi:hypothetical protein